MPTYEYACDACEHRFSEFQSMSDKPLTQCPECAKPSLRRLIGAGAGLVFKGSGFYINDYGKKSGNGGAKGEAKGDSTNGSSGEAKGESSGGTKGASNGESKSKPGSTPKQAE